MSALEPHWGRADTRFHECSVVTVARVLLLRNRGSVAAMMEGGQTTHPLSGSRPMRRESARGVAAFLRRIAASPK